MARYRQLLAVLLFTLLSGAASAQNNTNSPYTRYGYGQLTDPGSGNSKAMGGVAYALRDSRQINFANPAAYTAVDSLTFIFDGSVSLQNTNFGDGTLKQNAKNSSFDYIAMEFRLRRWCAMSIGLLPYSNVGYNIGESRENTTSTSGSTAVAYSGEGGLHQLYAGLGFKILKNLSVGANFSYLWGDVTHTVQETFPSNTDAFPWTRVRGVEMKSYKLDVGVQYVQRFNKKNELTVGAVYSPGHNLSNNAYVQTVLGSSSTGYTTSTTDTLVTCGIPTTLGAGLAYNYDGRLTVGLDFMFQNWGKTTFMNNGDAFCNRTKVALGVEYLPNPMGRSYLANIKYRMGAWCTKPYYKIEGVRAAKEYGVTAGFGLPIPRTRSMVNLSAQYVRTDGARTGFLTENTFRVCVGVTFSERWFFKWKVE